MIRIITTNPYFDKKYTAEMTVSQWKEKIELLESGAIDFISFTDIQRRLVTINPRNFASVDVYEVVTVELMDWEKLND